MEIFDVFSLNGIENYPAAGEFFLENVILKVSQTHFSKDFYPKVRPMPPPLGRLLSTLILMQIKQKNGMPSALAISKMEPCGHYVKEVFVVNIDFHFFRVLIKL